MDWEGWYWPNHFGDPVAEHHAVRNDVGVWDASPLRKWGFNGPDALAAADRIFTNDMLSLEVGQVRYAPFCDENGKMVGDGTVFNSGDGLVHRRHGARLRSRPLHERRRRPRRRDRADARRRRPSSASTGPARASSCRASPMPTSRAFATSASGPSRSTSAASRAGSRAPATRASSATSSSARPTAPSSSGTPSTGAGAKPYGLAAVETIRIESGLVFIGYDYFQHETSPFDMGLDKVIRLDTGDFCGKAALAAQAAEPAEPLRHARRRGIRAGVRRRRHEGRRARSAR